MFGLGELAQLATNLERDAAEMTGAAYQDAVDRMDNAYVHAKRQELWVEMAAAGAGSGSS